ncbi:MAG: acyltransferase [Burkholderiaceae bacterium]|nr:acyltransferase [Burkholderiaceae bacterium]
MPSAAESSRHLHWAALREAGFSAGLWFLYGVYRLGGRVLYALLAWPVALYFALTRRVARESSIEYLTRVGVLAPDAGPLARLAHVTRHIAAFADALLDKGLAWTGALSLAQARVAVDPRFVADVQAGRGGLIVVAHLGNLEVLRIFARTLPALRLKILVHTRHAQRFNRVLARLNPDSAAGVLQVTELDMARAVELADAVAGGEFVVIAADRVPVSGVAGRTLPVPFLGVPAPLPVGPWVLAAALDCPVYWLSCVKEGRRYAFECERLAERVRLPRAGREQALAAVMRRYAERLERQCRATPYAWFNFYPFWGAR